MGGDGGVFSLGPADLVFLVEIYCSGDPVGELCQFKIGHPASLLKSLALAVFDEGYFIVARSDLVGFKCH